MNPGLTIDHLRTRFPVGQASMFAAMTGRARRWVHAVEDVSFAVRRGELVGLVGESGSGKTTIGRSIVGLDRPHSGEIRLDGALLPPTGVADARRVRRRIQYIFQDPSASLDPRMRVERVVGEGLRLQSIGSRSQRLDIVADMLGKVGLPPASMHRMPHEFSGGQKQRIGIARAIAVSPDFIIADEPISGLDLSVQAQILNLLADLRDDLGLGMLLIAHDLPAIEHLCDAVIVLYLGRIVEIAPATEFFRAPRHPYSRALIGAVPKLGLARSERVAVLPGELPDPISPPSGCVFRTRCPHARAPCSIEIPQPRELAPGHSVACLRVEQIG